MLAWWQNRKAAAIAGCLLAAAGVSAWLSLGLTSGKTDTGAGVTAQHRPGALLNSSSASPAEGVGQRDEAERRPPVQTGSKAEFFKSLAEYALDRGPAAVPFLRGYLYHADWEFRCAALRALAVTGSNEAAAILQSYVSEEHSLEEAAQAVLGLGDLPDPSMTEFLIGKYQQIADQGLRSCLLETLAARPYEETAAFFSAQLTSPAVDAESKADALRALGFHQSAPIGTIIPLLSGSDVAVRAAAYDALALRHDQANSRMLIARLPLETEPSTRKSLYGALSAQIDLAPAEMESLARKEADAGSRMRAYKAWAVTLSRNPDPASVSQFEKVAIPELTGQALTNADPGEQRAALQALAMSRNPAAAAALATISRTSKSPRLAALAAEMSRAINSQ